MVIWYTSKLERNNNMAGKGDKPRPVNFKKYQENYEFIFGKKKKQNESCNIQRQNTGREDK